MIKEQKKKFDFIKLEDKLSKYYAEYKKDSNNKTRTNLYIGLKDLAFAVLVVGKWKKSNINFEDTSHDYATMMFERIITNSFQPVPKKRGSNRFPWNQYITISIRKTVYNEDNIKDSRDWVSDVDFILDKEVSKTLNSCGTFMADRGVHTESFEEDLMLAIDSYYYNEFILDKCIIDNEVVFSKKKLALQIYKSLLSFYSVDDIKRLYPVSLEYIENKNFIHAELDIKDFCITLISLAKRVLASYDAKNIKREIECINNFDKLLKGSLRSSLFLFTVAKTKIFPKELLFSLDIESLYRLCFIAGGRIIKIPKVSDFETLIGAVLTISKQIEGGKSITECKEEVKKDHKLTFKRNFKFEDLVSFISNNYNILNESKNLESVGGLLVKSMGAVNTYLDHMNENMDKINKDEMLSLYTELNSSMNMLSGFVVNLNKIMRTKFNEINEI